MLKSIKLSKMNKNKVFYPTHFRVYLLSLILISFTLSITAQNWNQLIKAVASDRLAGDLFGYPVAISGDYAIVGAYNEDEDAVGGDSQISAGSAYIFKRTGSNWVQETKIVASDRTSGGIFGISVAISGDYVVVGAIGESKNEGGTNYKFEAGAAYIFKRTGTNWVQEAKIVASDRGEQDHFGYSVAISGDYVVVSAEDESEDVTGRNTQLRAGSAYIFKRTVTNWVQEAKIVASDRAAGDLFGHTLSMSGDYTIVGAPAEDEDVIGENTQQSAGSAYIFKRTGTNWVQEAKIVASDRAEGDVFGWSVSISNDYAIVGAHYDDENAMGGNTQTNAGSAYIFKRMGTNWIQETKIVSADRAARDYFGSSVAISGDYAIVGAWSEDDDTTGMNMLSAAGSAYIFKRMGTIWVQEAKIIASDRAMNDFFGTCVAISGDYALVGTWSDDKDVTGMNMLIDAGSVYFFKKSISNATSNISPNSLKAYPSVTNTILTVEASEKVEFQIFNMLGQSVLSGQTRKEIDVSLLAQGTYIILIGTQRMKFIKT